MLGHDLARVLADEHEIYGLGRKKRVFENKKVRYFAGDLLDLDTLSRHIRKIRPEIVIHSAAKTQVDGCELKPLEAHLNNILVTKLLLRSAAPYQPLFIYISTDYVFDGGKRSPYTETDSVNPLNVYGATKWLGEEMVRHSGLNWAIIRTSWLYGKQGPNFAATILRLSKSHRNLKVVTDQKGSPTHARDLALGIKRLLESTRSGSGCQEIYHLTASGQTSWNQYAKEILKESGVKNVSVHGIKTKNYGRPALRPANSVLSNEKFQRRFGFQLRPWKEGLRDFLRELKD